MGGLERVQPLPSRTIRCFAVLGARSLVFEPQSPSGARGAGGGARAIGTKRGSGQGNRGPAKRLSNPDRRTASEEFPLENSGRHRPLPGGAFEGRRSLEKATLGWAGPEAHALG